MIGVKRRDLIPSERRPRSAHQSVPYAAIALALLGEPQSLYAAPSWGADFASLRAISRRLLCLSIAAPLEYAIADKLRPICGAALVRDIGAKIDPSDQRLEIEADDEPRLIAGDLSREGV